MTISKKVLCAENYRGKKSRFTDYTHIRAYHACRPENIQKYKEEGLVPYTRESALQETIAKLERNGVTRERIIKKFDELWEDPYTRSDPKVWLAVDKEELLTFSCHYLIYGSEFISQVAMYLGCRRELRHVGTPTIIVCDIPMGDIPKVYFDDLARAKSFSNCGFPVAKVAPENIVDFIYPTGEVEDPYYTGEIYKLNSDTAMIDMNPTTMLHKN